MALLKKINDSWAPSEKPNLRIGEIVDVTDYSGLVKNGMAVLVDKDGNELELPGQKFTCPICFLVFDGVMALTAHLTTHLKKNQENLEQKILKEEVAQKIATEIVAEPPVEKKEEKVVTEVSEEIKIKRQKAAEKAREWRRRKVVEL